ncbi:MAG: hypothetical protein ACP5DC_03835, partial [Halothiobacillaceae bacterium]
PLSVGASLPQSGISAFVQRFPQALGILVMLLASAIMPALAEGAEGQLPPGVTVTTSVETPSPVLRQEILVTLELQDARRGITEFEIHRPAGPGIVARYLDHDRQRAMIDGVAVDQRLYRWAILPTYPGPVEIPFSKMTLRSTAAPGELFEYRPAPITLDVQPLPSYLPTSLTVGVPRLLQDELPDTVAPDVPATRTLRLAGPGLEAAGLEPVLAEQLKQLPGQTFYPPEARVLDFYDPEQPLVRQIEVRLPFIARGESGRESLDWPQLRLPYIDPQTGRLDSLQVPAQQTVIEIPPTPPSGWWALLTLPVALFLGLIGRDIELRWQRRALQRRLYRQLITSEGLAAMYRVLLEETGCRTLNELKHRAPNPEWCKSLDALEAARFNLPPIDHDPSLREDLLRWLPRLF